MARVFAAALAAVAAVAAAAGDQPIVLPPVDGASGPTKMLVLIPGGNVPNARYAETAAAIQRATPGVTLWAAIPAVPQRLCILSCATSSLCRLRTDVEAALSIAVQAGWKCGDDEKDVWLAGHSLGGTCANTLFQALSTNTTAAPYAGLIVMGSYVDESGGYDVTSFPKPVLTLNTELDGGLARPGKTAVWFRQYLGLVRSQGEEQATTNKAVIVLPKLNHSDFCPGFDVPKDLMAEVSQGEATAAIGRVAGAFLQAQCSPDAAARKAALGVLRGAIKWTSELLSPFLAAQDMERDASKTAGSAEGASAFCAEAQRVVADLPAGSRERLAVTDGFHAATSALVHCHPGYAVGSGSLNVTTCSHADYYTDIANTGSITAASQLACKMLSRERIAQQLNVTPASPGAVPCSDVNKHAVEVAMRMAAPSTLERYKRQGRGWCFLEDQAVPGNVGPLWVYAYSLQLKETSECMSVASPILKTELDSKIYPGSHYCKVLSPARVLDWMMTDSLKKGKGEAARPSAGDSEEAQEPLIV